MTDDLLREIRDELRMLRAELRPRRVISHEEHLLLSKLIPAIKGSYGSTAWTCRELLALPVFRELTHLSCRELGTLLSKAAGVNVSGFTIEPSGKDHGRVLWALKSVDTSRETRRQSGAA